MVNILIIDDDNQRTRKIISEIFHENVDVDVVTTKRDAMKKMSIKQYDLIILDIMLPDDMNTVDLSKDAGLDLLNQIENVKSIKKPLNIVAITSGQDVYEKVKPIFDSKLITLFLWADCNDDWINPLKSKLEYLKKVDVQNKGLPKVDIAIITAVESEYIAAKALYDGWDNIEAPNDPNIYQMTSIMVNGSVKNILLTLLPEMGMSAASCLTTKIICTFSPEQIYMVGICGGIKGEVELGDIVIATTSWDYGSGKIKPSSKTLEGAPYYELEPSPNQISIKPMIASEIKKVKDFIISDVSYNWNQLHPEKPIHPSIFFSPMPSGAAVICDEKIFSKTIRPQHRKCVALDMETYGVYFAILNSSKKQIDFFSIKCVSDYADIEKNDDYHEVSCYISANFIAKFIENYN